MTMKEVEETSQLEDKEFEEPTCEDFMSQLPSLLPADQNSKSTKKLGLTIIEEESHAISSRYDPSIESSFNNASSVKLINESRLDVDGEDILLELESDLSVDAAEIIDTL